MKTTEHTEQALVVQWLEMAHPEVLFHSIPNGAQLAGDAMQRVKQINKLKSEGMLPGCADLFLCEPRGKWSGCYLEMKSTMGKVNENQQYFLAEAEKRGYYTIVAHGFEEAQKMVEYYLRWSD